MMAALFDRSGRGAAVCCYWNENDQLGKKVLYHGQGPLQRDQQRRTKRTFMRRISAQPARSCTRLSSAAPSNQDADGSLIESLGVPLKVERGERVFPVSDHSNDVIQALRRELERLGVEIRCNCARRVADRPTRAAVRA